MRCLELHPSPPIPLPPRVWDPAEVWGYTAATLSHCFPPYLNVSTQNLKHLTNRLVREESLSSQSLLHTIHIPGLCSDQAYWAAQWGKESPAPNPEFSKLPDLLKFSPTHSNDPDPCLAFLHVVIYCGLVCNGLKISHCLISQHLTTQQCVTPPTFHYAILQLKWERWLPFQPHTYS